MSQAAANQVTQPAKADSRRTMAVRFGDLLGRCKRCGKPFEPKPIRLKTKTMTECCETCQCRNFFDGLDMPTPPALLDRYTKLPTLTDKEWHKKLNADEAA